MKLREREKKNNTSKSPRRQPSSIAGVIYRHREYISCSMSCVSHQTEIPDAGIFFDTRCGDFSLDINMGKSSDFALSLTLFLDVNILDMAKSCVSLPFRT